MATLTFKELSELQHMSEVWGGGKYFEIDRKPDGISINYKGSIFIPFGFISNGLLDLFGNIETGLIRYDETCWEHT